MRFTKIVLATAAACIALLETSALAQQFNFAYRVTDARINIFDDGKNTRIQLPEGTLVPAVFSLKTQGEKLLDLKRDGNFLVMDGLHQKLRLVWANGREATASFTGSSDADRLGVAVAFGSASPTQVFGSTSAPVATQAPSSQDRKQQATTLQISASAPTVPALPAMAPISDLAAVSTTLTGEMAGITQPDKPPLDDKSSTENSNGLKLPMPPGWTIDRSDQTVSAALTRWAANAGWQLAWQAPRDLPAFRVSYAGDFEYAVESLMRDSQNSEYPLHACLYDNKVVRVLHITQSCAR